MRMGLDALDPALRQDKARLDQVRAVAAEVLHRLGSDVARAEPTSGWVNAGWIVDRYVVRVSLMPEQSNLHREVAVANVLPPEVGYPEVLDVGVLGGHEYVVTRRLSGTNLAELWPTLEPAERADALSQLWDLAVIVHRIPLCDLGSANVESSPFYANSLRQVTSALVSMQEQGVLTDRETASLLRHVERFFDTVGGASHVLNHGDLHIGNALWEGGKIVSLLDFEFAVTAPVELDLNELAKHAFGPASASADLSRTEAEKRAVIDVVAGLPVNEALLLGYSILLESWFTERSLSGLSAEEVRATDSCQRLVALADGEGGHLATLLQS